MLKLSFRSSASLLGSSSVLFYLMVKSAEQGELMPQRQACVLVLLGYRPESSVLTRDQKRYFSDRKAVSASGNAQRAFNFNRK